jgi:hypothetical protein
MRLWCCQCGDEVEARLTSGAECYPHRPDLAALPRWKCDACGNHVGTHHKTKTHTKPLGNIPSVEIKNARIKIHALIDPVWKSGKMPRGRIYAKMSERLGYQYHTGEIKSVEEARKVYVVAREIVSTLSQ